MLLTVPLRAWHDDVMVGVLIHRNVDWHSTSRLQSEHAVSPSTYRRKKLHKHRAILVEETHEAEREWCMSKSGSAQMAPSSDMYTRHVQR